MKYKYKSGIDDQTENRSDEQGKNKKKTWSADVYVRPFGYFKIITHRPRAKYIFNNERRDVSFSKLYEEEFKKLAVTVYNIMEEIETNYKDSTIKIKTFLRKLPAGFFRVKQIKDKQQNLINILVDKRKMKLLEKNKYNSDEIDEKITAYAKKLNSKYTNKKQEMVEKFNENISVVYDETHPQYEYQQKINKFVPSPTDSTASVTDAYDESTVNPGVTTDETNLTTDITKTPVPKVVTGTPLTNTAGDTSGKTEKTPKNKKKPTLTR